MIKKNQQKLWKLAMDIEVNNVLFATRSGTVEPEVTEAG